MDTVDVIERVAVRLEGWGVPVVFSPGWQKRGRPYFFEPHVIRNHHTATPVYQYDYPSLGIVRDGRDDLPGPLSQFGGGRHTGTVFVIAAGYANDGGPGGWNGYSGNGSGWGIEWENDGVGEGWGVEIERNAILLNAALCIETPVLVDNICEHYEWSPYKIDRHGSVAGDDFRWAVSRFLADGPDPVPSAPFDPWPSFLPVLGALV